MDIKKCGGLGREGKCISFFLLSLHESILIDLREKNIGTCLDWGQNLQCRYVA